MKKLLFGLIFVLFLVGCSSGDDLEVFINNYNKNTEQYGLPEIHEDNVREIDDGYYIDFDEYYHLSVTVDSDNNIAEYFVSYTTGSKAREGDSAYEDLTSDGYVFIQAVGKALGLNIDELYNQMVDLREKRIEAGQLEVERVSYCENGYQIILEEIGNLGNSVWF